MKLLVMPTLVSMVVGICYQDISHVTSPKWYYKKCMKTCEENLLVHLLLKCLSSLFLVRLILSQSFYSLLSIFLPYLTIISKFSFK